VAADARVRSSQHGGKGVYWHPYWVHHARFVDELWAMRVGDGSGEEAAIGGHARFVLPARRLRVL
jgi:hypothetical protein